VYSSSYTHDRNHFGPVMTLHHTPFVPLTKQAVADILGISVRPIENWINEGILPAPAKLGNRVYWHPDVFYEWMSNRLREPLAEGDELKSTPPAKKPRNRSSDAVGDNLRASTERKLAGLQANI
jgi:predicted DNA-binding transcriptional regulator AlpA